MKHVKKLAALAMAMVLCLALASCGQLVPSSYLEIDPATGAGTAQFTMVVPKNGANDVGNNFIEPNGDSEPNETGWIKTPQALLELMKSKVPSGFEVTMEEVTNMVDVEDDDTGEIDTVDKGSFDYTVSFSFSSIDDYNAKVKQWLPDEYWTLAETAVGAEIAETSMTVSGDAENADVTLTTDMRILEVMCQWAYAIAEADSTGDQVGVVLPSGQAWNYSYIYNMDKGSFTVKFNGKETQKQYSAANGEITAKASGVDTTAESEPTQEQPSGPAGNPSTGEPLAVSAIVLAAAAAGALVIARKRSK